MAADASLETQNRGYGQVSSLGRWLKYALLALIGSHGYLEVALRDGSAAQVLSAQVGEAVSVNLNP